MSDFTKQYLKTAGIMIVILSVIFFIIIPLAVGWYKCEHKSDNFTENIRGGGRRGHGGGRYHGGGGYRPRNRWYNRGWWANWYYPTYYDNVPVYNNNQCLKNAADRYDRCITSNNNRQFCKNQLANDINMC